MLMATMVCQAWTALCFSDIAVRIAKCQSRAWAEKCNVILFLLDGLFLVQPIGLALLCSRVTPLLCYGHDLLKKSSKEFVVGSNSALVVGF